jgi:hypothetical protein
MDNNVVQKNKLGVVSYIAIALTILSVIVFGFLFVLNLMTSNSGEYDSIGSIIIIFIFLLYFVYHIILTGISIFVDLKKGKNTVKDIIIAILLVLPIIVSIFLVLLVLLVGAK